MLNVNVICLGKMKEDYLRAALKEYEKRLSAFCSFSVKELEPVPLPAEPSEKLTAAALRKEGELIKKHIPKNSFTYALCIEGKQMKSEALAEELNAHAVSGKQAVNFIIGSSCGLCDEIKQLSDKRLSMSQMTFPHQLARIMLAEQIYRAFSILAGTKYHK